MAGNDYYQLTGFLLSQHSLLTGTGTPVSALGGGGVGQVSRWWWVLVGGPGHLILINYPQ